MTVQSFLNPEGLNFKVGSSFVSSSLLDLVFSVSSVLC